MTRSSLLPHRVTTPRLELRHWEHGEAEVLHRAITESIDHLRPWMAWIADEPMNSPERVAQIERWMRDWEDDQQSILGAFLDGEPVGSTGLHRRHGPGRIEIGYWIHVDHLRRGYATEITAALTTAALARPDVHMVEVHTDEANEASASVPARLGFHRDRIDERPAQAPAETGRMVVWTMTADQWPAAAAP